MLFFASQSGLMRLSCDGKLRARAKIDLTIVCFDYLTIGLVCVVGYQLGKAG